MSRYLRVTTKVVVIASNSQARTLIQKSLKNSGFLEVTSFASAEDALSFMETEDVGLLFANYDPEEKITPLHFLQLTHEIPDLKHLKVAMFLGEADHKVLPGAFDLGLLSYHSDDFSANAIPKTVRAFYDSLNQNSWDTCLTSAFYVRQYLKDKKAHEELLQFERDLIEHIPANANSLLRLGEAQALNKFYSQAELTFKQAEYIEPRVVAQVQKMKKNLIPKNKKDESSQNPGKGVNVLGLLRVLVVDTDDAIHKETEKYLKMVGVSEVEHLIDGEQAVEWLKRNDEPCLIIHEWRLAKVNGPVFVQKIRQMGFHRTAIMILSAQLTEQDKPLLKEMGVAEVVSKPFDRQSFLKALITIAQQETNPTQLASFERQIIGLIRQGKIKKAIKLKTKMAETTEIPASSAHYIEAEMAFQMKDYLRARAEAIATMKNGRKDARVLNLIGRTLMKLRDFDSALRFFEQAQASSPANILRMCAMVEANGENGDKQGGIDLLNRIKQLDKKNEKVALTEANFQMTVGDVNKAAKILQSTDNVEEVLSYLNNRGIALARSDKLDEAIAFYDRALQTLPKEKEEMIAKVKYNQALAHIRGDGWKQAKKILKETSASKEPRMQKKSKALLDRMINAEKTGADFKFASGSPKKEEQAEGTANNELQSLENQILMDVTLPPTERCVSQIIKVEDKDSKLVENLVKELPKFVKRDSIEREESMGADKLQQSA